MGRFIKFSGVALLMLCHQLLFSQWRTLDRQMQHLRVGDEPEWTDVSGKPIQQLRIDFSAEVNDAEQTLRLKQEDVRRGWDVVLNGKVLGKLNPDEHALITYFAVPAKTLADGTNTLVIKQTDGPVDDIRVGEMALLDLSLDQTLGEAGLDVSVIERESHSPIPARITVVDSGHALQPVEAVDGQYLAVRPGCIYTGNGNASFTLPAGTYTVYASRGFEYGVDSFSVVLKRGERIGRKLVITREVPTPGWVSSDTHIHTLTYSGHGDATIRERVLTVAGEGIEFPIMTDHNIFVDADSMARAMKVRSFFTPVIGDEFTTAVGHFNVFPMKKGSKLPDPRVKDWNSVIRNLDPSVKDRAVILNHARDMHNNFRPFDPGRHLAVAGIDTDGNGFPANAMEVLNSSSQQKDYLRLYLDWFGMMNRGHFLTPVGGSDSHDVSRYLIGQGRTYIRCSDSLPGRIDVHSAMDSFLSGKVMVSFGLLAEIKVNRHYGPGELAPVSKKANVSIRVLGPRWSKADRVSLYANGEKIREARIEDNGRAGVKWTGSWNIPVSRQDIFFVAIAEGPGRSTPFWQIPKPYSPTSVEWDPEVIGSSGAAWIDGDGDGKKTSAYEVAGKLVIRSGNDLTKLLRDLSGYDIAVSVQAAAILQQQGIAANGTQLTRALEQASPTVQHGFHKFRDARAAAYPPG